MAHKILTSAYHMLKDNLSYTELGEAYLDRLDRHRTVDTLKRRLERLGYEVALHPTGTPSPGPVLPSDASAEGVS